MPKVRVLTDLSLLEGSHRAGDELDLSQGRVDQLIAAGLVELVEDKVPEVLGSEAPEATAIDTSGAERATAPRVQKR